MKRTHIIGVICGVLFTAVVNTNISYARSKQAAEDMVPRSEYEKLKQEVEALKSQVRMLMEHESWVRQAVAQPEADKKQEAEAVAKVAEPKQDDRATAARAETASASSAPGKMSPEMGLQEGDREKEAEEAKIELDQFLRSQKVLFKKGDLQIEFSASYAQDTAEISPYKLRARTAGAGVLFRYGLIDDLELDIAVPFTFQELELDTRSSLIGVGGIGFTRQDSSGLGDVSGSLRWGALHEEGLVPETTLSLNVKSDSGREGRGLTPILGPSNLVAFGLDPSLGTGFWNIGGSVSLVKTIDPVVLFGSLGYNAVLERNNIDPGDQIPYSLGMGFSLNDRVSFSAALNGAAIRRSKLDGRKIEGSGRDIHSLNLAVTVQVSKGLFVEPFVNFGLSEEATDLFAGVNVPYRFDQQYPLPFFK
ncbi:transporter [Methylocaldum szegediense]|uniref:transporter n=1 Tax=Methylocaldum szegediense TaxID=73780 RepID=UPI000A07039A|nr:transporter [Methylocaldum szegediense]